MDVTDKVVARMSYSPDDWPRSVQQSVRFGRQLALRTTQLCLAARRRRLAGSELLPLESQNFDVSFEWYYGDDSYVSVGFFDKTVKNFLGTGVFTRPLFGLLDPTSGAPGTRSASAIT
jgi:outer membrane receptor protein involved in Fe transport